MNSKYLSKHYIKSFVPLMIESEKFRLGMLSQSQQKQKQKFVKNLTINNTFVVSLGENFQS